MKKRILAALLAAVMVMALLAGCGSQKDDKETSGKATSETQKEDAVKEMTDVTLNEVAHSIFYAPMYVAVEEGYFEDEGINLDLVCGFGVNYLVQNSFTPITVVFSNKLQSRVPFPPHGPGPIGYRAALFSPGFSRPGRDK